ncbi:MAG: hypothetical protein DA405_08970 [Bacteroidetes bacterium]|nr:MAG: hypothetical protein DA405_08970 [Bacteroidota bacterium]
MEKIEKEILARSVSLFNRYGLRPVTMDDIAKDLSISKKTLYKYFANKEELVRKGVNESFASISSRMLALLDYKDGNAIDMLFQMDAQICVSIEEHDPSIQFQLERYYPEVSASLEKRKREIIFRLMTENIKRGKEEGIYREELNAEIVSFLYYSRARLMLQEESFFEQSKWSITEIMREILIYHIRGIASAEGIKYLDYKLKNNS